MSHISAFFIVSAIVVGLPKRRKELGVEEKSDYESIAMRIKYTLSEKCWNNFAQGGKVYIHEANIFIYAIKV